MKQFAILILICSVLIVSGCVGQNPQTGNINVTTGNNTVTPGSETTGAIVNTTELSSDLDSISAELASINTSDLGDTLIPITADDIDVE